MSSHELPSRRSEAPKRPDYTPRIKEDPRLGYEKAKDGGDKKFSIHPRADYCAAPTP